MHQDKIGQILHTYDWIKVKRYNEVEEDNEGVDWRQEYFKLLEHHKKETDFLINFTRNTVKELTDK